MNEARQTQCNLPDWLSEALEESYPTDDLPNKRSESRRVWSSLYLLTSEDDTSGTPITVRMTNVASAGIGFVSRKVLTPHSRFKLTPEGREDAEPVHVRVVHCTKTVQGYKVGCSIELA